MHIPSSWPSLEVKINSKVVPSPRRLMVMISRLRSKTLIPVPSNATRVGSFWDLNRKNTDEDIAVYFGGM